MNPEPTDHLSDDELADLARFVDGTLPAERRAEVEARVAASPLLASVVESQNVALNALRGTTGTGAPARLRGQVERRRGRSRASAPERRRFVMGGAVAAVAAVAVALVLVVPGTGGPSVAEAAALAIKPPTQAAPRSEPATPQLLRAAVDDVPFPNYAAKFGWRPSGAREDEPSGRHATTVYYEKSGRRIAYTIVSGDALDPPSNARSTKRAGVEYRVFRSDRRTVVTWKRGGHTCVLSSRTTGPAELLALADWRGKGAIPF